MVPIDCKLCRSLESSILLHDRSTGRLGREEAVVVPDHMLNLVLHREREQNDKVQEQDWPIHLSAITQACQTMSRDRVATDGNIEKREHGCNKGCQHSTSASKPKLVLRKPSGVRLKFSDVRSWEQWSRFDVDWCEEADQQIQSVNSKCVKNNEVAL